MLHNFFLLVVSLSFITTYSQQLNTNNTVGLLYAESEKVSEGALLFAPLYSKNVYLIDNCGSIVNQWMFDSHAVYSGATLLEDGSVIKLVLSEEENNNFGRDACFERRSWDNTLLWKFCGDGRYAALHSDFYVLPNGNVLSLMEDVHTFEAAILAGADAKNFNGDAFQLESVVEIMPTGISTGEIMWEWHLWDHLIQDYDSTKLNYGSIEEHPRKMNINRLESSVHFNSINYNRKLDQIMLSNWSDHEIYIIDHTTTSDVAIGSVGGKYNYGGDFLFRWGNDKNYNKGKQNLFGQHNPGWIPSNYGRFSGMISVFNNEYGHYKGEEPKSAVVILNIDPNGDGVYDLLEQNTFAPAAYEYLWTGKIYEDWMLSRIMSGVEVQPNGNFIVCEATKGRFSEIDRDGNVVWIYKSPDEGTERSSSQGIINQGETSESQVYKIKKYSTEYAPLKNIQLCNNKTVENINEITEQCLNDKKPVVSFNIKEKNDPFITFETLIDKTDSIVWNFGDGETSIEIDPKHQYEKPGNYNVCLAGYNCYGSIEKCISIIIEENIVSNTSLTSKSSTKIQPNPAKKHLKIITSNLYQNKASIYNIEGQLIKDISTNEIVDINNLLSGIYFIRLESTEKLAVEMLKFIKIN